MRKIIHKWFWLWDFDKEEKWLNEMAAKGFVLVSVGYARYDFEDCAPGEYNIRLEMLKNTINHPESQNYIRFLEETGVEHVGSIFRWIYFRKKADTAPFDLFSDIDSRINHLNRVLFIPAILGLANLFNAINMTHLYFNRNYPTPVPAILIWVVTILMAYGFICLFAKKQRLKKERILRE